ncbi:MAG: DUF4339 domain-containing protein [Prevotella sp.]|jgi:hypothetical protein
MEYYVLDHNNKPYGPFTLYKLRKMNLTKKSYVWAQGWDKWVHAGDVEEINKYVLQEPHPAAQPKQLPNPVQHVVETKTEPQTDKEALSQVVTFKVEDDEQRQKLAAKKKANAKRRNRLYLVAAILFAIICLLTSTNPNIFAHRREARAVVEEAVQADISSGHASTNDYPNGTSVDRIFDATLVYHNYYIFSTTTVQLRQTTHFLSFGILGHVFTASVGSL